jgi:hypothetical protein
VQVLPPHPGPLPPGEGTENATSPGWNKVEVGAPIMAMCDYDRILNTHYGGRDLATAIFAGLQAAGKDLHALNPDDLAAVNQLHFRGKEATLELAQLAGPTSGLRVLDVGGGLGGPARTLASEFNCHVTVLDLTARIIADAPCHTSTRRVMKASLRPRRS